MKRLSLLIAILSFLYVSLPAQENARFGTPVTKELIESEENPTLLLFTASWCAPCRNMRNNIFPLEQVSELLKKFNLLYIDIDTANGYRITQYYCSHSVVPYYVILDTNLEPVAEQIGASDADTFCRFLLNGLPEEKNIAAINSQKTIDILSSGNEKDIMSLSPVPDNYGWSFGVEAGVSHSTLKSDNRTEDIRAIGATGGFYARSEGLHSVFETGINLTASGLNYGDSNNDLSDDDASVPKFFYIGIPFDLYLKISQNARIGLGIEPQINLADYGNSFDIDGRINAAFDFSKFTLKLSYNAGFVNQNKNNLISRANNNFIVLSFGIKLF